MKFMTISEVSKTFHVSTRMLRYYDGIGLLPSKRRKNYAYRVYDEADVQRLQQILILRKLRIPLKKIALIFDDAEQIKIIEVFQESIMELDKEISALQTIHDILCMFITRLNSIAHTKIKLDLLNDIEIMDAIQTLSFCKTNLKETYSMNDLKKANETLSELKDVRILYLPPCSVASSHFIGENPEDEAGKSFSKFIRSINLQKMKPDLRVFGFNNPSPNGSETYGYEFWVTIPDDLDVPQPLVKKHFAGGLYAAHCINMGDFHEWKLLVQWVENSTEYEFDIREPFGMGGCLEEHLNAYSYFEADEKMAKFIQVDLLTPIKVK